MAEVREGDEVFVILPPAGYTSSSREEHLERAGGADR